MMKYLFKSIKRNRFTINYINKYFYHIKKMEINEKIEKVNLVDKYKREKLLNCLARRFFVVQSFEIYNGIAGFYDYGPPGCALKNNVESYWREHFILEENMLEINTTCICPEPVFKASVFILLKRN